MKLSKRYWIVALCCAILFVAFTVLVMTVDVSPIGPMESEVGCSSINGWFRDLVGEGRVWYAASEITGALSLVTAAAFAAVGVYQLCRRKKPSLVDRSLFLLAGLYAAVLVCYAAFEVIVINDRPVLVDGVLEASYPSSHTMLALTVMLSAAVELFERCRQRKICRVLLPSLCTAIGVFTVVARALSGVHWLTDVVGSLLLSAALLAAYFAARLRFLTLPTEERL